MNGIGFVLPVMRPQHAKAVLDDLCSQTILPDKIFLVDNGNCWRDNPKGGCFNSTDWKNKFKLDCFFPIANIGTNQVWNLMWSKHFAGYKYVGVIGDDYRINKNCIEFMKRIVDEEISPATTCAIIPGNYMPTIESEFNYIPVQGKGHMGFSLFEREFLLTLPIIPKEFFIFFGDNWIGYHLNKSHKQLIQVNSPISHQLKYDLSDKLNYKKVINRERIIWKQYLRGEVKL